MGGGEGPFLFSFFSDNSEKGAAFLFFLKAIMSQETSNYLWLLNLWMKKTNEKNFVTLLPFCPKIPFDLDAALNMLQKTQKF